MSISMVMTARFPLGTFLGHRPDGRPAPFPDTARLHAALVNAAGQGSTAVVDGAELRPAEAALMALRWLEEHPPSALSLPLLRPVAEASRGASAKAWRDEGVIESKPKSRSFASRKVAKAQSDAVAVSGPIGWGWSDAVPSNIRAALEALCADVSCLGEADSPVVLEIVDASGWEPTHVLDERETAFPAPGGLAVPTPVVGRFDELETEHRTAYPAKRPTPAADRHSWSARPTSHRPGREAVRERIYRTPVQDPEVPWTHVITIPATGRIRVADSVAWSVAFHKALAARMPDGAPALVTGRYGKSPQPANRVAIHVVAPHPMRTDHAATTTFVIMLPPEIEPADLAALQRAITGLNRIYCAQGSITLGEPEMRSAAAFWMPPAPGTVRRWRPYPALVPEVRRKVASGWRLEDAAAVAVGHLLRDRFAPLLQSGSDRYRQLAQVVRDHGVCAHDPMLLRDSNVSRYVHKVPKDLIVQPLTLLLDPARTLLPTTLFALGQSRHLGGGLMVPEDAPAAYADVRGIG